MFIEEHQHNTLQGKMRLLSYRTFYDNVKNRLAPQEEILAFDFLSSQHNNSDLLLRYYQDTPKLYRCLLDTGFGQPVGLGPNYLVAAGSDKVVLLLEPDDAVARGFPFLATLEGNFFQPYYECATTYWQTHVEPSSPQAGSVLSSPFQSNGWFGFTNPSPFIN